MSKHWERRQAASNSRWTLLGFLDAAMRGVVKSIIASLFAIPALLGSEIEAAAEDRALKLFFTHTGEKATITFKRDGRYDPRGLAQINRFLRDWRRNEPAKMDPRLLDLVWETYSRSGGKDYIHIVSAYRSPATNNMLRNRSRVTGVAKNSQHMLGKAMDFYIPGVKLAKLRAIAMQMQVGGVGFYPNSGSPFVHLDVGRVRAWPRMSRQELAGLFPSGKTIHLPADGRPLPGYDQALADTKRLGSTRKVEIASVDDDEDVAVANINTKAPPSKLLSALLPPVRDGAAQAIAELSVKPAVSDRPEDKVFTDLASYRIPLPSLRPVTEQTGNVAVDPLQTASLSPLSARPTARPLGPTFGAAALSSLNAASMPGAQTAMVLTLPVATSARFAAGVSTISDSALMGWALHSDANPIGMTAPNLPN